MLLLIGDRFAFVGGVLGRGGVLGLPIGDRILCGVLDLDFLCLLIGLCLKENYYYLI